MPGYRQLFVVLAAGTSIVGSVLGVASAESCPTHCASGKVLLGISAPTSGSSAAFGEQALKAMEVAARELNAAGGLMGIPVELAIGDDRCDPGMVSSVTTRHIKQDQIAFVIGPICPSVAIDAAPIYANAGVLQLVPTVTLAELAPRRFDTLFRIAATDKQEAEAVGVYIKREQSGKTLTVVYNDYPYRRALVEMIKVALPAEEQALATFEPILMPLAVWTDCWTNCNGIRQTLSTWL